MSEGADTELDAEPVVHHPDDAGYYLQVCNFSTSNIIA
jgi:hypothetical protein